MSVTTQPAFIHTGTWDAETRKHPAMLWMEGYTKDFNARAGWDQPSIDWHSSDFAFVKPDGATYTDPLEAFKEVVALHAPFTKEFHEPYFLICWETQTGWGMIGQANVFANCAGNPGAGETKVTDGQGRDWDIRIPGAFHFTYVKRDGAAHGAIEMSRSEIMMDTMPAVQILLKRGALKL